MAAHLGQAQPKQKSEYAGRFHTCASSYATRRHCSSLSSVKLIPARTLGTAFLLRDCPMCPFGWPPSIRTGRVSSQNGRMHCGQLSTANLACKKFFNCEILACLEAASWIMGTLWADHREGLLPCSTWNNVGRRERQLLVLVEEVADVLVQDHLADAPHWKDSLWPYLHPKPAAQSTSTLLTQHNCTPYTEWHACLGFVVA